MHLNPAFMKMAGFLVLWAGTLGFVYASSVDPRGALRRYGSDYVAKLDADFRSMLLPKRGSELAWLQVVAVVACIACHALTDDTSYALAALLIAMGPRVVVTAMLKRRRDRIDAQAHRFALSLANALRTTASVGDAMRFTVEMIEKPIREEIEIALREIRVGSTGEEALLAAAGRARAPSLDIVVSTILIGQKTGGDLPRILEQTAGSLRELKRLEEYTDKVTRQPKQALVLLFAMVIGLVVFIPKIMPGLLDPLFSTPKGQMILSGSAAVFVLSVFFAWRVTRKSI